MEDDDWSSNAVTPWVFGSRCFDTIPLLWISLIWGLNRLTGSLASDWEDMTSLAKLELSGNQISGSLPSSWQSMTALTSLRLGTFDFRMRSMICQATNTNYAFALSLQTRIDWLGLFRHLGNPWVRCRIWVSISTLWLGLSRAGQMLWALFVTFKTIALMARLLFLPVTSVLRQDARNDFVEFSKVQFDRYCNLPM